MRILGIDPGVHGALAWYYRGSGPEDMVDRIEDMPVVSTKRGKSAFDVDGVELARIIKNAKTDLVVVEQVQSRPRQGGQFAFGVNYGRVLGVIEALGLPLLNVSAQKWKQAMGLRGQDKSVSVKLACELFPGARGRMHGPREGALDGRAEAALIAYYGSIVAK